MKKLIIVILLLAIAGISFYTYNNLFLVDGIDINRENIVKKVNIDEYIVVEYPDVFDEQTTKDMKDYAEDIIKEISVDNKSDERLIVDRKMEYIQYNEVLLLENKDAYDLQNHKFITDFEINEKLKKIFSEDLRYRMKENNDSEVNSADIVNTYYKNISDYTVNIDTYNIYISYNDYKMKYPLEYFADCLNYDLGIEVEYIDHQRRRYINRNRKLVCLTYDDGPNVNDLEILEILESYDSKATFFQIGRYNNIGERSNITMELIENGNRVENHSFTHIKDNFQTKSGFLKEQNDFDNRLAEITGENYQVKYYRPPYGHVNDVIKDNCKYPLILWNVDTMDWKDHDSEAAFEEVKENVFDGAIILMHSTIDSSVEATEMIVPYLIDEGYEIVTIEEMFEITGAEVIAGKKYRYINKKDIR